MSNWGGGKHAGGSQRPIWVLALSVAVVGMTATLALGTRAGASPGVVDRNGPCPTEAYTGSTISPCKNTTTTTHPRGRGHHPHVTSAAYSNGRLTVGVTDYPQSAAGDTIRLYVGGDTHPDWAASVGSDQSARFSADVCLAAGSHTIAGVDQTDPNVPEATGSVSVSSEGPACGSAGSTGGKLAFTGANVVKMLIAAIVAIVVGYVLVRFNRQRRRAGKYGGT